MVSVFDCMHSSILVLRHMLNIRHQSGAMLESLRLSWLKPQITPLCQGSATFEFWWADMELATIAVMMSMLTGTTIAFLA